MDAASTRSPIKTRPYAGFSIFRRQPQLEVPDRKRRQPHRAPAERGTTMQPCVDTPDKRHTSLQESPLLQDQNARPDSLTRRRAHRSPHSIADHRPWLGRPHRTSTEAADNWGRESAAPCGGAAGWATAEPASGPAQAATKGTQAGRSRRAGCTAAGGARFRHGVARCGAASPWPRLPGRRAPWRSAGGNGGARARTKPRSQSAGACGGSLAAPALARRSPARRLPLSLQAA